MNPDRAHVRAGRLRPGDELPELAGVELVRLVTRAGRLPWSPYRIETGTGRVITLHPWRSVLVARRPAAAGADDVRIEFRCPCGHAWSEWSPSGPATVFQRDCPRCGTNCYGG